MRMIPNLRRLLEVVVGKESSEYLIANVALHPAIMGEMSDICSRAVIANALNLALLHDLLGRVPTARFYMVDLAKSSRKLVFDHGALRTVDLNGMGKLPAGKEAVTRLLIPLGYEIAETYPLDRLDMTGRAYRHLDYPEDIPQFFVSEIHVDRFSKQFQSSVMRITGSSIDPLDDDDRAMLQELGTEKRIELERAATLLPSLLGCFKRQHDLPHIEDYKQVMAESPEMAWISTEGNAFNHATDRVQNIVDVAVSQRVLGRPMKHDIECSASGRIKQTAYLADPVDRLFISAQGDTISQSVPGSFFEFIERAIDPATGALDLSFDTGNAQGIFKMTAVAA
jgi:Domain of unknown function (DUF1338)